MLLASDCNLSLPLHGPCSTDSKCVLCYGLCHSQWSKAIGIHVHNSDTPIKFVDGTCLCVHMLKSLRSQLILYSVVIVKLSQNHVNTYMDW